MIGSLSMFLSIKKVLEKANARTQAKKEALIQEECVAMISPTIQRKRVNNVDYYCNGNYNILFLI